MANSIQQSPGPLSRGAKAVAVVLCAVAVCRWLLVEPDTHSGALAPRVSRPPDRILPVSGPLLSCALAFSPSGDVLATGGCGSPQLVASTSGALIVRLDDGYRGRIGCFAFSSDGTLVAGGGDGPQHAFGVPVWDTSTGTLLHGLKGWYAACFVPAHGNTLVTGSQSGHLILWDAVSGMELNRSAEQHRGALTHLAVSSDGRTVVSAGRDRYVRFWDADTLEAQSAWQLVAPVSAMALASTGALAYALRGRDCAVYLRQPTANGSTLSRARRLGGGSGRVSSVSFSPDGQLLAAGIALIRPGAMTGDPRQIWYGGEVVVWDVKSGRREWHWRSLNEGSGTHGSEAVSAVAFSSDGGLLVAATEDPLRCLRAWETARRR